MKKRSVYLFCALTLLGSCSGWQSSQQGMSGPTPSRGVASSVGLSCNGLMDQFLQRPALFTELNFSNQMNDMGYGYVLQGVRDLAKRGDQPHVYREIASKMEDHARKGIDMRVLIDELDPSEQRAIWNGLIRPQIFEVEEQMLAMQAQSGDEIARFLISVPQGVQRDNAEAAVVLMRKVDPSLDNQAIVARLYRELGTCLTR